jgi:hypothetical protein
MKNLKQKKVEGNLVIFEDLGIYSRDPVKDKEINKKLVEFLKKQGVKLGNIRISKYIKGTLILGNGSCPIDL